MKKLIYTLLVVIAATANASDWNWGANEQEARMNWNLLEQKSAEHNFEEAHAPCAWLLKNTPDLNESLYIKASYLYEQLVRANKDNAALKSSLQDTALLLYDKRISLYGNEAALLNRKGEIAFSYLGKDISRIGELHQLYTKIVALNGTATSASNLTNLVKIEILEYRKNLVEKGELLQTYLNVQNIIDEQLVALSAAGKSTKSVKSHQEKIESSFAKYVDLNCQDIQLAFKEKFTAAPDKTQAERIFKTMSKAGCTEDPLFVSATEFLLETEPKLAYYEVLSTAYFNQQEYNKAYSMYEKGITLSTDSVQLSNAYFNMANIRYTQGEFSTARSNAIKSINYGSNRKAAYNLIGAMYEQSYESCKSENPVKARAIFIAAHKMYAMAGNADRMVEMKKMFPTSEEVFMNNMNEGEEVQLGCWLNTSVKLETK